ncbi:MAG: DUF222 domain-containing protein [Actinomycetota bacterium]
MSRSSDINVAPYAVDATASRRDIALARPLDQIEAEIAELAAHVCAGTARLLALVGEFDAREGWAGWGIRSCSQWLAWRCGFSDVAAREHVRVARALRALPKVHEAFARAEITYSKVRAITRVACSETEEILLEWARHATAAQLDRVVRGYRLAKSVKNASERHRRRALEWFYDDEGVLVVRARLDPEDGAVVVRALEAAVAELEREEAHAGTPIEEAGPDVPAGASPEGPCDSEGSSPQQQRRADALTQVCQSFLTSPTREISLRDDVPRALIVLHVDPAALATDAGERCELEAGPPVASETARRLACDATLLVAHDGPFGEVASIGRRSRVVPRGMRRALRARDRTCRFPACTARRVDAHHIRHWSRGGETSLENLVLLCRRHHRLVHEGGFVMEDAGFQRFAFRRSDGSIMDARPPVVDESGAGLARAHGVFGLGPETTRSLWDGTRPDYSIAVAGLLSLESRVG